MSIQSEQATGLVTFISMCAGHRQNHGSGIKLGAQSVFYFGKAAGDLYIAALKWVYTQ
jgi:hypothetical protein